MGTEMLIEEQPTQQAAPPQQPPRLHLTWGLDEVSASRRAAAWVALAVTIAIAVILLLGGQAG
jgi:hypothetical protein